MRNSSRIGFTLAVGMFVGAFSVMMNLGSTPAIPSHSQSEISNMKSAMESLSDEQKEAVLEMVTNSSGLNIQVDNIEQLQELKDNFKDLDLGQWNSVLGGY